MYGYGASLGGGLLSLYLANTGSKSVLSGALGYCIPMDTEANIDFFSKSGYSLVDKGMGTLAYFVFKNMAS